MKEEVTPESAYCNRRELLKSMGFLGAGLVVGSAVAGAAANKPLTNTKSAAMGAAGKPPSSSSNVVYTVNDPDRPLTKEEHATSYNNFYEFSLDKKGPKLKAAGWTPTDPWIIHIGGMVEKPLTLNLKEWMAKQTVEDRTYRFRCVEAWSMVLPWRGFPLAALIDFVKPKSGAKFVKMMTYIDRKAMPNIAGMPYYPWPYTEGLTMAEATHPLTFMATGLYGKALPNQNGAPIRLVVPWKYGFKSIKSVAAIEFVAEQPKTLWQQLAPSEYGFYANVNPDVPHPRWTQKKETRIDGSFFSTKINSLMFNGYEKEVGGLYAGLDLKKNF